MKNRTLILSIFLSLAGIFFTGCSNINVSEKNSNNTQVAAPEKQEIPDEITEAKNIADTEEAKNITARFEIYTNGTKRIFTNTMYHQRSENVFITAEDPSLINVTKSDITWGDFFETLPFSLTDTCLVTGTKQTFCTGENGTLQFYLNEVETPNVLEKEITENDFLRVIYE